MLTIQQCFLLLMTLCHGHTIPAAPPVNTGPLSEQSLIYHEHLMDGYDLYWNFNSSHILFKTHVKTNGYIGFGLSPNGAMTHSDVIIGWVKDGKSYFTDRHAEGNFKPALDSSQDWHLVNAAEVGEYTTLTFVRKLDTCDPEDRPITNDTARVIFSYNSNDPADNETILYHGQGRRGTKSVLLLNPPDSTQGMSPLPDDVITLDFLNGNYSVPGSDDTFYRCKVFKLPDLGEKHHLIRYEPVIQPGHEQLVHHILIYYCGGPVSSSHVGNSYLCYEQAPAELKDCANVLIAWAVGGKIFDYPLVAGYPVGRPGDPQILIMETHYNNPELREDFVDDSGLRLHLTKQLRQYDAGVLEIGLIVDYYHIIPPYEANFVSSGHCQADCIEKAVGDQEIKIFADFLHAHLLGRKLRTRHFRNGVELEPIAEDNNYDFNYQEMRKFKQEKVLKKGDSLLLDCVYDSSAKTAPTFGGLKTTFEMCLAFMLYYPKMELTKCHSRVQYTVPSEYAGQDIYGIAQSLDWTNPLVRQQFKYSVANSDILNFCMFDKSNQTYYHLTPVPTFNQTYEPPKTCQN